MGKPKAEAASPASAAPPTAQEAHGEIEERLELVMEGSQLGYWDWNIATGSVHRNARWAEMLGYTMEEIEFSVKQWTDLHHPDDRAQAWQSIQDHLEGRTPAHRAEYRMRTRNGQYKWILDQAMVVKRDAQGRPLRMCGTHTDITERKQAEERLRESETRFSNAFEYAAIGMALVSPSGAFLKVNQALCEYLGYLESELLTRTFQEITHPEDLGKDLAYAQQLLAGELRTYQMEKRYIHRSGQIVWALLSVSLVRAEPLAAGKPGQPLHFIAQVTNITERKRAEAELRLSEEKYRRLAAELDERVRQRSAEVQDLYNNAPTGYHSLDAAGRVVEINQTELNWLGCTRDEALGLPYKNFLSADSAQLFDEIYPQFQQTGRVRDIEFELRRKDGSTFPILLNSIALLDEQGRYLRSRTTIFDNTQRKQAEIALRQSRDQLKITNTALLKASRAKNEFLATMSHELRTPLNGILGLCELMRMQIYGALNEKQMNAIKNIDASGQHLLSLINDVLDLSKVEAGMLEVHPEPLSIAEVCQASLTFIKEPASKKGLTVEFIPDPRVSIVLADERRLKQILVNLLSNAVKFTPSPGKVTLQVQAKPLEHCIDFAVIDTGIGIAADDLPRLFSPFTQVDSSLTRQYEGTGLGLALVKDLVELHGGSVRVTSQPGAGSQFTVSLPWQFDSLLQEASDSPESEYERFSPAQFRADRNPPARVLLVDDVELNLLAIGDYLDSLGYGLIYARGGQEAIEQARKHTPDIILMDIQMPDVDGLEATRQLRREPRFAATPIIALTALAMAGDREKCLAAGASGYISKPVNLKQLADLMRGLLKPRA